MPEDVIIEGQNLDTSTEGQVTDTEVDKDIEVEDENFNPDTLFGEEDGEEEVSYQFGDYDLSKYKDVLDFTDKEMVEEFNQYAQKYADKGFTQEQVEFILDEKIAELNEKEPKKEKKLTQKEVKERLQKSLTKEEIRNYTATTNFVRNILSGTEFEDKLNDIVQNPTLVKLFHNVYKKSIGSTTNLGSVAKKQEKQIKTMSLDEAYDRLLETTRNKEIDRDGLVKELRARVSDREGLENLLSIII